jgi:2-C-methyl-D-erythritol 2,4-cyclodiphosphate synthase
MRVGIGYDVHPFEAGRPLVLGGVEISHDAGLAGYSDGDALCHAIIDALLGAAGLGDIGALFPSGDERLAGVRSLDLLREVVSRLGQAGYRLVNVDATVIAEAPQLAPYREAIRKSLAEALDVEPGAVGVKATTTDRLGAIGRGEGIASIAVALVDST